MASSPIHAVKQELRRQALHKRALLSPDEREEYAESLLSHLFALPEVTSAHSIAAYASMGSEMPTRLLLARLREQSIEVLVPRLGSGKEIGWSYVDHVYDLDAVGKRRPKEPTEAPVLGPGSLAQADVILTPALLIDAQGYRLGRGAAWYDQALTFRAKTAVIIGVVYPWENNSDRLLPHESHDVPVDIVASPTDVRRLRSQR